MVIWEVYTSPFQKGKKSRNIITSFHNVSALLYMSTQPLKIFFFSKISLMPPFSCLFTFPHMIINCCKLTQQQHLHLTVHIWNSNVFIPSALVLVMPTSFQPHFRQISAVDQQYQKQHFYKPKCMYTH
jgi:hypothetical protein